MYSPRNIALVVAGIAIMSVITSLFYYRALYLDAKGELEDLRVSVKAQNVIAKNRLNQLTDEVNAKQAELDKLADDQEIKDGIAQDEINRLTSDLEHRPVRVRVVPDDGWCGSGSSASGAPDSTGNGAGDAREALWVLPEQNTQLLAGVIKEVEQLSAAYRSCRATLLGWSTL